MRRLLVSTALVSIAAMSPAHAEMEVTVGGYMGFQAAAFDNDAANSSDRDFQSETELHVKAKGKADNGLEYGANMELTLSTSDTTNADETNLYLAGDWGRVELGDQDGAGSEMAVLAPSVGIGQVRGSYNDFVIAADRGHRNSEGASDTFLKAIDTNDATKVTYYSPKLAGFQAGVSYAPEVDDDADGEQVQFADNAGNHDNAFELGLHYAGEISGVGVKVGGKYTMADAKTGSGREDIGAWGLGAQLAYNGFTVGGSYVDDGDSGLATGTANDDVTKVTLGVTYETKVWGVGLSYAQVDFDNAGTSFEAAGATGSGGDYTAWGVGATYKIAPGLSTGVDFVAYDRDRVTGADSDGNVLITEIRAAF